MPNCVVATMAKQPADSTSLMVMVDGKPFDLATDFYSFRLSTGRTNTALSDQHFLKIVERDAVIFLELEATQHVAVCLAIFAPIVAASFFRREIMPVRRRAHFCEIFDARIRSIFVDECEVTCRPRTVDIEPSQLACMILRVVDTDVTVLMTAHGLDDSGFVPRLLPAARMRAHFPSENAGHRIVVEHRLQVFMREVGARRIACHLSSPGGRMTTVYNVIFSRQ